MCLQHRTSFLADYQRTCSSFSFVYRSVAEMPALYPDRVITIRGQPDNQMQAEAAISQKLRESYEKEMSMPMVSERRDLGG